MNKIHLFTKKFLSILVIFVLLDGFSIFNVDFSSHAIRLSDKRHAFDWDSLLNEEENELKRILAAYQRSSDRFDDLDDFYPLDRHTRKPKRPKISENSETDEDFSINRLSHSKSSSSSVASTTVEQEKPIERAERLQSNILPNSDERRSKRSNVLFFLVIVVCSVVGFLGLLGAGIFWYRIQKRAEQAADVEYPSFHGGQKVSPSTAMSDRKLAQSAQMFHYQQQRQQMIAQEKARLNSSPTDSDATDDESPEHGDHTVYECPGLAPTGEMEVRNPLYIENDLNNGERTFRPATTNEFFPETTKSTGFNEKFFS